MGEATHHPAVETAATTAGRLPAQATTGKPVRAGGLSAVVAAVLTAGCLLATAADAQVIRQKVALNDGWGYLENDVATVQAADAVPAARWERVTLPHTWNAFDPTDVVPGYRREGSWYRRTLDVTRYPADARFILAFEGANTRAEVFVNGRRAGGHIGGYIGFDVDITPFVQRDAPNEIRVRVDNSDDPDLIPSHRSDFVIYGGLTRDVWLRVVPSVSVGRVEVKTPEVSRQQARAAVTVELANPARARGDFALEATLVDPRGRAVSRTRTAVALSGDSAQAVALAMPAVRSPMLWSPASPSLYRVAVTLTRAGAPVDRVEDRIGFRWFRFEPGGPFYLNGERLLLRGTHRHEEHAGLGAAVSNAQHRRDLQLIKEMGANFVRLAHYPQDPEVYAAADSLGLLVWDELPWDRGGLGGPVFQEHTKRLLREQIRQNINHPSIILWSLGNEVYDLVEAPNSGDVGQLRGFLDQLSAIVKEMDPARPTAMRKFDLGADRVDVYSPSIWAGWYGGVYRRYETAVRDARARFPRFFHMEYGADAHVGRHTDTPISGDGLRLEAGVEEAVGKPVANIAREGDWSESYQTDLMDWHLMISERQDSLTGNAQWVFKDFATPLRPDNPIPYVNQKGLLTRDGTPKDAYYLYQSYWTTTPHFAYIVSHTWTERSGPAGRPRQVRVYSNCAEVEMLANGGSLGVRRRVRDDFPAQGLRWDVPFNEGDNALVARCTGRGENATDSLRVRYTTQQAGRAEEIQLTSRPLPNGNLLVEAVLVDRQGRRALTASDRIFFNHHGFGALRANLGTPTGSLAIEAANGRAAIELVPPPPGERAFIVARTQELNGTRLIVEGAQAR